MSDGGASAPTPRPAIGPGAFEVLAELAADNRAEWYHANKRRLIAEARQPFEDVLLAATDALDGTATPLMGSRMTMFRQRRDTRFSPDKTPYKTTVSGLLTDSGTKDAMSAGMVYLELSPTGGMMASGYYMPENRILRRLRDHMIEHEARFFAIVEALEAAGLAFMTRDSLKAMPRGYADFRHHRLAPWLKLKHLVVVRPLERREWQDGAIVGRIVDFAGRIAPLGSFGREALARAETRDEA